MGKAYELKCSQCEYGISVLEGFGFAYSPDAVFFGHCDDPTQNWSVACPDGYCEKDKPYLLELVDDEVIRDKAFELLANGATPDNYGHELYACPKCMRLANRFYFELMSPNEQFVPDYKCLACKTSLLRVKVLRERNGRGKIVYRNNHQANWKCPECGCAKLVFVRGSIRNWD